MPIDYDKYDTVYCPACDVLVKSSDPRVSLKVAWDSHKKTLEHIQNLAEFKKYPAENW